MLFDISKKVEKTGKGWWKATNDQGKTGLVASNYVAIVAAPKEERKVVVNPDPRESVLPPVSPPPAWEDSPQMSLRLQKTNVDDSVEDSRESIPVDKAPTWDEDTSFDNYVFPRGGDILESSFSLPSRSDNDNAEKQLEELLQAVEDDRRATNKIIRDADERVKQAEARALELEVQMAAALEELKVEREERERKEKTNTELWKSKLEAAEEKVEKLSKGKPSVGVEEVEELKNTISQLQKDKEDLKAEQARKSKVFEERFKEERVLHSQTNERCQELTEMYETARHLVKDLEEKLTKSQREVIAGLLVVCLFV